MHVMVIHGQLQGMATNVQVFVHCLIGVKALIQWSSIPQISACCNFKQKFLMKYRINPHRLQIAGRGNFNFVYLSAWAKVFSLHVHYTVN